MKKIISLEKVMIFLKYRIQYYWRYIFQYDVFINQFIFQIFKRYLPSVLPFFTLLTFILYFYLCNVLKLLSLNSVLCRQQRFPRRKCFNWLIFSHLNRSKQTGSIFSGNPLIYQSIKNTVSVSIFRTFL